MADTFGVQLRCDNALERGVRAPKQSELDRLAHTVLVRLRAAGAGAAKKRTAEFRRLFNEDRLVVKCVCAGVVSGDGSPDPRPQVLIDQDMVAFEWHRLLFNNLAPPQ